MLAEISSYADEDIERFMPYYFQAATQLGGPAVDGSHVQDLRRYDFSIDQYTPRGQAHEYDPHAMADIKSWFDESASQVLMVYGEFDPWSAGAFPQPRTDRDTRKFFVAGGNHGSKFAALNPDDKAVALGMLSSWLGKEPDSDVTKALAEGSGTLEDVEAAYRARHRLP